MWRKSSPCFSCLPLEDLFQIQEPASVSDAHKEEVRQLMQKRRPLQDELTCLSESRVESDVNALRAYIDETRSMKAVHQGKVEFHKAWDFITPQKKEPKPDRSLITIYVHRLSGDVCALQFRSDATIIDVKQEIEAVWGVRNEAQTMMIGDQAVGNTSSVGSLMGTSCDSQDLAITLVVDYSIFKRQHEVLEEQIREERREATNTMSMAIISELMQKRDDLERSLPAGALR